MSQKRSRRLPNLLTRATERFALAFGLVVIPVAMCLPAGAQMQAVSTIDTFAGNGTAGYSGDGGPATSASVHQTEGVATDSAGNVYIADWTNNVIRKVAAGTGVITTVAGNGTAGYSGDGGAATSAQLKGPTGIAVDHTGNVYIADQANNRIRKVAAATGVITTAAGNGTQGFSGDGGAATSAAMYSPTDLTFDSAGNLYISDNANNRIRKVVIATGVITTVAGNGTAGFTGDGAAATSAELNSPAGLAFDSAGNLYIADVANSRIRKVASGTGVITTYAGNGTAGFAGDGGAATSAQLNTPARVVLDSASNLYIADQSNNRIRKVSAGIITTVAGNGTAGYTGDGGPATSAEFNAPIGIAVDNPSSLYISDFHNNVIRRLAIRNSSFPATTIGTSSVVQNILLQTTAAETITSITIPQSQGGKQEYSIGTITGCTIGGSNPAGTICTIPVTFTPAYPGQRWVPLKVVTSAGNINFGLQGTGVGPLTALTPGIITTYAGNGTAGSTGDGGPATSAQLNGTSGFYDFAGNLYIAENTKIRKVDAATGTITTYAGTGTAGYAGDGGPATSAQFNRASGLAFDSAGNLYIADYFNYRIRKINAATGIITTVAGTGISGYSGDGGAATSAQLGSPGAVVLDTAGNLYIADYAGVRIRKVAAATGIITTVAGTGVSGYSGDGGPATSAQLKSPEGMSFDSAGNLYFADVQNNRIRKITISTGIITTVAGNGTQGYSGDGGPATSAKFFFPHAAVLDGAGNIYVGDQGNARVRKVDAGTGIITTIAGNGTGGFSGDGGPATSAQMSNPYNVALDNAGNLVIGDLSNNRVRKVDVTQSQLTYPTPTTVGASDSTDNPQTAIVSNIGNADLTIPPPTSGNNPNVSSSFAFASASTCPELLTSSSPQTLAGGANCTIAIDFDPIQVGALTGSAILTDGSLNIAGSAQTIHLQGTGVAAGTTTTVAGTPNPSVFGQSVTFTATVAPAAGSLVPTGTVQFSVDGTAVGGPVTLSGGVATFTSSTLAVGTHTVKAVYTPDSTNFTTSNSTTSQVVSKATPGQNGVASVTLASAPNPSGYGQLVTFTATVPSGATGTVQFKEGATLLGTGTISGTTAAFTTSTLAVGTHSVTAAYSGDANFNTATSAADSQVVNSTGFPPTPVHSTSAAQNIFVTIPSTETITSISIPQSQGGQQEYTIQSITGCTVGASNPAGTVCTISITFTPAYPGQRWVPLQVVASGGNFNVGLSAVGLGPLVALTPGIISTVAGNGTAGYSGDNGAATSAQVNNPVGLAFDSAGNLYIGDNANNRVRKVNAATGTITTVAGNGTAGYSGDGGPATSAQLNGPEVVALDSAGNLYIAEYYNNRVRKVAATTGIITTVAGNGTQNYSGDGGPATSAALWSPTGVAVDSANNLYIADFGNHRVRKVAATTGIITTVAGNGTQGYSGDGGLATSAELADPTHVVLDSVGNLIIADPGNNRVRKVTLATGIITTVAGNGTGAYSGDGGLATSATLHNPEYLTLDSADNLYIGDYLNNRVRKVEAATGIITTLAGSGTGAYAGDGGAATSAALHYPSAIAFDNAGNLYVSDLGNSRIRKLDLSQSALTYPTPTKVGTADSTDDPQTVTVSNIGNASLTVPPPSSGSNPNVSASFALDAATTCPQQSTSSSPQTLAAGANCNYAVDFVPATAGTITGSAVLTDNSLNLIGSTQTIHLTATGVAMSTATTLTSSANPSSYGQSVIFTATVAPTAGTAPPTGTVQFSVDGAAAGGPVTLNGSSVATFTTSTLAVGTHSITAVYTPDSTNFTGSSASPLSQIVNKATLGQNGLANITLASSPNPSAYQQSVTFTATVPSGVTGTVQFMNGTTSLGTGTISGTTATFTTTTLAVGTHPVTAVYSGDANYNPATSAVDNQVVGKATLGQNGLANITLASSPNPSSYGQSVIFTATVPTGVTGTVTFSDGTTTLGTGTISGTTATFTTTTLPVGTHPVTAVYGGDANYNAATSAVDNQVVNKATLGQNGLANITLISSPNPSIVGQSVVFTATVPAGVTGTVQFKDGTTLLGTGTISGTTATLATATLAAGTHPVTAVYGGDANYNTATSTVDNQVVSKATLGQNGLANIVLTSSPNPSTVGQSVTFAATVPSGVTGTVQFVDGTTTLGTGTIAGTTATFTTTTLAAGTHPVTAVYSGDANYNPATSVVYNQVVNQQSTTTTVSSSVNPSAFMQSVTFTATVAPTAGSIQPTGTVQFSVDGTNVGSPVTLNSGTAAFTISTLAVGLHAVTAVYTPNTGSLTGSNGSISQQVGAVSTSTTTLSVAPGSVMYGDTATLTAVVAPSFATGTVSFFEGTTLLGTASLDSTGTAVLPISTLNAGVHNITAKYNGDPGVPANTSNTVQLTVTQRTAPGGGPAITVTVNDAARTTTQSNPPFTYSAAGQLVNGDTYATAIGGTPSYATSGGTTAGTYSITVTGLTSANYSIAFVPGTLTVTAASTTTTLVASPTSTQYGDPVTLTATVISGATGTVSFYDGSVLLGTGAVSNGVATMTTNTLIAGTHTVTAVYNGDATYASSQSGPATVTVAKKTAAGGGPALTITVQDASRQYNTADPQFNYVVTGALVNGDTYATAVTGVAAYSAADTPASAAGSTFPISLSGLSSANYETAFVNGTLTIVTAPTTTTLATSTASAQYGDPVTLTATVAPSGATGTVLFMQGANVLGTGTVSGGVATLTTSTLPAGAYTITSSYQGDTDYGASTSGPITLTINPRTGPGGTAALTVTVTDASRAYGEGNPAFSYTVAGTLVNGDTYATAVTGVPVYSTTAISTSPAGAYPISVAGLNSNNYVIAFVNGNLTVTRATLGQNGLANITLTSSPNPSNYGQSVTFTATVPSGVTGTVQFVDGSTVLGTATLSGTTATFTTTTLAVGTHPVTAVYSGDGNYNPATSAIDNQVVNNAGTATTVASSVNPSAFMQSVTFTATVAPATGTTQPTGTVQFSVDGANVGSPVTLANGTASFAISTLAVGAHTVLATYTPDSTDFTTSSGSISQQVGAVSTSTTTLSVAPGSVMYGDTATLTAVVAPSFATGTVSFFEGTTLLGTASLDSTGTAVLPISTLNAGVHNITAKYNGDPGVPANTSNTVQLTVTQRTAPGGGPAITVTVNDAARTTTQSNPPFTYSAAGQLVNGDTYATAIGGTPSYATAGGTTAGTYSITVTGLTSANYSIAFVPGTLTVTAASTTTTLVASPASTQYGDPVTLTATVTSGATGTVSFYDGSVLLGTGAVSNGVATLTTATLNADTHTVTAVYNGDATYASSQSGPATVTVAKKTAAGGGPALTITVQNESRQYNTADPQSSYVVTGTLVNGDTYATAVTGVPAYSVADTPASPAGSTFPISVSGLSSANYEIAVVNGTLTIVTAPTTTTLATSTASAQYGDQVTLTATVAPSGATGTVLFMQGAQVLGTGTVSGGVATLTTTTLPAGSYTITSSYQGDTDYGASNSGPVTLTVTKRTGPGGGAALTVTVADASRTYGQGNPAFSYTVTGTLLNGDTYATAVTGVPVYSTTAISISPAGTYPISVAGLNSNNYVVAFVNGTLTVARATLGQNGLGNITLTSSPNPSNYGQPVTFTATVPSGVTGTVQFVDGSTVLGAGTIAGTTATLTTSTLTPGTHPVTAVYSGDANYNPATSAVDNQVVNQGSTTTTVTSSLNPSAFMQSVTFTATVAQATGTIVPTGTVQFSVDGTPAGGPVTLSNGTAAYTISTLAVGLHTVSAVYTPDTSNLTGSSGSISQRVGAVPTSTTTLTVGPATVMYGDTATLTAVVAPSFATGTVSFFEGSTLLGTASLDSTATAVLPISTLNAGVHSITAKYNGDPGVPASTSNTVQLTVTQRTAPGGGAAITITVNDAGRTTTQSNPPFTYSEAGQLVNGDTYATAISGTPSYATAAGSTPGTYSITVAGLTSANYSIAFVPGTLTVTISPSTTTLVAGPAATQYGDPVTLTATVTSGATGTVSFYDGSVLLGTGSVSNGVATLTTATLNAGTHSVTAVYNGDATYASSQSAPATVTVSKKAGPNGVPALTITVQNASREYNTADPQFNYLVTGTLVNGDTYATAVTGVPVYSAADTWTSPAGSTFPISVSGLSSANYTTAFVNGTLTIVASPTTTTLAASTASAQYGDPVTLTATVAPTGATGTVVFMQGSTVLGTGTISGGVATLTTSTLPAGTYTITSTYQGDTNYGASTSGPVTLTINPRTAPGGGAALTVTVADATRPYGQGNPAFSYSVTGTLVNGDTNGTAVTGVPVYSTAALSISPAGTYPISVAGLNSNNYVVAFVNGTLTVTKATQGSGGIVSVTLTSSLNPSLYGNAVTFTATVPPAATGAVQFEDGSTVLGTGTIANGIATMTTSTLAVGTHPMTAVYSGDGNYNAATSAVYSQTVNAQAAVLDFTLTLTSAQSKTVLPGASASYTLQVAPTNTNYPGPVTFSAAGLPIGANISFSPATVAAGAGPAAVNFSVQTAGQVATGAAGKLGKNGLPVALGLLLLPFVGSRRLRRNGSAAGRYVFLMLVLLGGIVATSGMTGCGFNGNGFFGQAPHTYNITITATSGTIQHSVNVTLNVE